MRNQSKSLELYAKIIALMSEYESEDGSLDVLCSVLVLQLYKADLTSVELDAKISAIIGSVKLLQRQNDKSNNPDSSNVTLFSKNN
jgi:hypothetical protein